jgi:hypothetical protein
VDRDEGTDEHGACVHHLHVGSASGRGEVEAAAARLRCDGVGELDEAAPEADSLRGQRGAEGPEAGVRGAARGERVGGSDTHRVASQHGQGEAELALGLAVNLHHAAHFLPDERREAGEGEDGRSLQPGGGDLKLLKDEARGGVRQTTVEGPKAGVHSRAREVRAAALARARVV